MIMARGQLFPFLNASDAIEGLARDSPCPQILSEWIKGIRNPGEDTVRHNAQDKYQTSFWLEQELGSRPGGRVTAKLKGQAPLPSARAPQLI
jgi:hypothetical protein